MRPEHPERPVRLDLLVRLEHPEHQQISIRRKLGLILAKSQCWLRQLQKGLITRLLQLRKLFFELLI